MSESKELLIGKIRGILSTDSRIDLSNIHIDVALGKVKVIGTVSSLAEFNAIENDILGIEGIKAVDNQLKIVYPGDINSIADQKLRMQILASLISHSISTETINIDVQNGLVVLSGVVESDNKKNSIHQIVKDIGISVIIIDKLSIVSTESESDQIIANKIWSAIDKIDPLDNGAFVVYVNNGNVIINGKVKDWTDYNQIEYSIRKINNVKEIDNQMILV